MFDPNTVGTDNESEDCIPLFTTLCHRPIVASLADALQDEIDEVRADKTLMSKQS